MRVEKRVVRAPSTDRLATSKRKEGDFAEVLATRQGEIRRTTLQELLKQVDEAAALMKEQLTEDHVFSYRERVRTYLKEAVQSAYLLQHDTLFVRSGGRRKIMQLVEKADEKLAELLEVFLREQAPYLRILKLLDEIRGLLIDLVR